MIHTLIEVLMGISSSLGLGFRDEELEHIAVLVHRIMSYQSRQFHTLEHVFGFLAGADEETSLAAIFHDLIYFQVDNGFPSEVKDLLSSYITRSDQGILLRGDIPGEDRGFYQTLAIFAFEPGQTLDLGAGLNEFLSALVMVKLLGNRLSPVQTAAVTLCIEASIPFRGKNAQGQGIGEILEARLRGLVESGNLQIEASELPALVHRAIAFANRDVKDFSLDDPGEFLSNTWKLLPESNAALRSSGTFSIREYRRALEKMRGFFGFLAPENIYHSYRDIPDEKSMQGLRDAARRNLGYALEYMDAKLLAVAILEALAEISGGDAPMALFTGDIPHDGRSGEVLMDFLPKISDLPRPEWLHEDGPVYRLLKDGRLNESSFDLKNSPLALYIVHRVSPEERRALVLRSRDFFAGKSDATSYLMGIESGLLRELITACSRMLPTRRLALDAWATAHPVLG